MAQWSTAEELFAAQARRQEQHRRPRHSQAELEEALESLVDEYVADYLQPQQRAWTPAVCCLCRQVARLRSTSA
jgi:hypothetical protein